MSISFLLSLRKVQKCKKVRILPNSLGFFWILPHSLGLSRILSYSSKFSAFLLKFRRVLPYPYVFFRILTDRLDFSWIFSSFLSFFRNIFGSLRIISILYDPPELFSDSPRFFQILPDSLLSCRDLTGFSWIPPDFFRFSLCDSFRSHSDSFVFCGIFSDPTVVSPILPEFFHVLLDSSKFSRIV